MAWVIAEAIETFHSRHWTSDTLLDFILSSDLHTFSLSLKDRELSALLESEGVLSWITFRVDLCRAWLNVVGAQRRGEVCDRLNALSLEQMRAERGQMVRAEEKTLIEHLLKARDIAGEVSNVITGAITSLIDRHTPKPPPAPPPKADAEVVAVQILIARLREKSKNAGSLAEAIAGEVFDEAEKSGRRGTFNEVLETLQMPRNYLNGWLQDVNPPVSAFLNQIGEAGWNEFQSLLSEVMDDWVAR